MKGFLFYLAAHAMLLGTTGLAKAQPSYAYTAIDVPGAFYTFAAGINNAGQIVGEYIDDRGTHGFMLTEGRFTTLDAPGATFTQAWRINDSGQIVGEYIGTNTQGKGFLLSGGAYTAILPPGAASAVAYGINNAGQIVGGYATILLGGGNAFLQSGGNYTALQPPGTFASIAFAINDAGHIVGGSSAGAFLLSGGSYTQLNIPGSFGTEAHGINNADQIVGTYEDLHQTHGFLLSGNDYTTLDIPGAQVVQAFGINDAGQIVGEYTLADGTAHGFLATPIPEPATLPLLAIGLVALIYQASRRRARKRREKGVGSLFQEGWIACRRGLPRARNVDPRPSRSAVAACQLSSPYGAPRWAERRSACSSASDSSWLTYAIHSSGRGSGPRSRRSSSVP
jgi:probable HAF family extracellular repeat protein